MKITPVGIFLCTVAFFTVAAADKFLGGAPPPGAIQVGVFTPGGCIHVCEDIAYCEDARINEANGACWLIVDRGDPAFLAVQNTCRADKPQSFKAVTTDGQWALRCG